MCADRLTLPRRSLLTAVPGLVLLAACGQDSGPVAVRWGKENCEYCGMIIDDPRFAAQVRGGPGRKVKKFDDLGDGVLWLAKQSWADEPATEFWVGDVEKGQGEKGQWIDGRKAWYMSGYKSPMGHGFGAVAERREGAIDFAALCRTVRSTSRCETPGEGKP